MKVGGERIIDGNQYKKRTSSFRILVPLLFHIPFIIRYFIFISSICFNINGVFIYKFYSGLKRITIRLAFSFPVLISDRCHPRIVGYRLGPFQPPNSLIKANLLWLHNPLFLQKFTKTFIVYFLLINVTSDTS